MKEKFNSLVKDYKLLLRSIPATVVTLFVISVVCMNLLANKTVVTIGDWFALDGGIVVSWMSFLSMDIVCKHFGPKASTRLSVFATLINLLCCFTFFVVSIIPSTADDYTAFNSIFGGTWFILLSSTIAFLCSAAINNGINFSIGQLFKKNPDGKLAYMTRTYVSTAIGQFLDNMIFAVITFMIFAPIYWDGFSWTFLQCITCSLTGAIAELLMEVIFSPIGYKVTTQWKKENVGKEYLDFISSCNNK